MPFCIILLLVVGSSLLLLKDRFLHAQLIQDNTNVSRQQRLGPNNILGLPDGVSRVSTNHKNSSLDEEFILLRTINQQNLAISNPDYGLSTPILTLMPGENFNINSSADSDIMYTSATMKLIPITSSFPPSNMRVEEVDPKNDISLGKPITIGSYTGNSGTFVIPHTASPGYYLLYVYFYYPNHNITAIYNTVVTVERQRRRTRAVIYCTGNCITNQDYNLKECNSC